MSAVEARLGLDRLASGQLGLVSVHQLSAMGLTQRRIGIAVEQGRLLPVRRKVYRLAGAPFTWESAVLAAVLACPNGFVASHFTAVRLWRLLDDNDPGPAAAAAAIHLSGPQAVRLRGVKGHESRVPPGHRAWRFSVPVTSVGRTLLDVGVGTDIKHLGRLTDEALRRGLIRLDQLRKLATAPWDADGRRKRGALALSEILTERSPGYDAGANAWERRMDVLWTQWGLPHAERQYEIVTAGGVYRPDRAIVELRIAIDWNGFGYHGRRSKFDADSKRRSDLAAAGWVPLDFTSRSTPEHIRSTVWSVVHQSRGRIAG